MAHIVAGFKLYGKVDQVGNSCYVATKFFHVALLPLIPLESWAVVAGSEEENEIFDLWKGHRIPLNWKSIFFAWFRVPVCVLAAFGLLLPWMSLFMAPPRDFPQMGEWETRLKILGVSLLLWVIFLASYWLSRANEHRATELVKLTGESLSITMKDVVRF